MTVRHPEGQSSDTSSVVVDGTLQTSILLVDDRPENLLALRAILEPLGHRLVLAHSGEEALRHVLREDFAVILLDVEMPGTNGLETARLIKRRTQSEHVPIIFLTAQTQDRRQVSLGYESGAVDYLFKPFEPAILCAKVGAFVELHHLRAEFAEVQGRRFADLAVRESEERFRLVQKATNDVIWDWDLVADTIRWSQAANSVFGLPGDTQAGDARWWLEHIHPQDRNRVETSIHSVIDGQADDFWSAEYRFRMGGGTYRDFLDRGYVVRDTEGHSIRMIGAMQDVSERVRAREAAAAAREAAEEARVAAEDANRMKTEFLATMSHEFRTPLNAILGYVQLLDMGVSGPVTEEQHAHLQRLHSSGRHLLQLVEDVLDVAKIDADRLSVLSDTLDASRSIESALALVQPQASTKGIRIEEPSAGCARVPLVGDEHRVRQVLVNLLANAVKFTPAGGVVTVTCGAARRRDASQSGAAASAADAGESNARQWAFVRVQDTGPGISPELAPRLFEPFAQGDGALTRPHGGSGLGLAISRRLARLMGGDLVLESAEGEGAAFTLWLPAAAGDVADAEATDNDRHGVQASDATELSPVAERSLPALDDVAFDALLALGGRVSEQAEAIADRYVTALRADGGFPGVRDLPAAQIRDHATPFVGLLAAQLMTIGETRGKAADLLADGAAMQRAMSELHGAQRHRLGWKAADVEREIPFLLAELERVLNAAGIALASDDAGYGRPGGGRTEKPSDRAVVTATQYASDVARRMLEHAVRTAVRALRHASSIT